MANVSSKEYQSYLIGSVIYKYCHFLIMNLERKYSLVDGIKLVPVAVPVNAGLGEMCFFMTKYVTSPWVGLNKIGP
jgi:hypothetical protein